MNMKDKFSFEKIDTARKLLDLEETATIVQIKTAYRNIAQKYHPDTTLEPNKVSEQMIRKLNDAFQILIKYSQSFPISFRKQDLYAQYPEQILYEQFKDDWLYS